MKIDAFLFDLDGVILDSEAVALRAFRSAYSDWELPGAVPTEAFVERFGMPIEEILRDLSLPGGMAEDFRQHSRASAHLVAPYPGILTALTELRRLGQRIGVVTGKDRERTEDLARCTGIDRLVECFVTPDDAPGKPEPDGLILCLFRLATSPERGIYVGDSSVDMRAARRVPLRCAFARWGKGPPLHSETYDLAFDTPEHVVGFARTHCQ